MSAESLPQPRSSGPLEAGNLLYRPTRLKRGDGLHDNVSRVYAEEVDAHTRGLLLAAAATGDWEGARVELLADCER